MPALAERVSLVPANRTVERGRGPPDSRSSRSSTGSSPPRPAAPPRAATGRRSPTASPASTACTSRSPRRCATRCRASRARSSSSASTSCSPSSTSRPSTRRPRRRGSRRRGRRCSTAATRRGILALQFAIAGMNAHINNDLAHALVLTWQRARPRAGARQPRVPRLPEGQRDPRGRRGRHQGPAVRRPDRERRHAARHHRRLPRAVEHPAGARGGVEAGADHARACRTPSSTRCSTASSASPATCCCARRSCWADFRRPSVQRFRLALAPPMSHPCPHGRARCASCRPQEASGR